MACTRQALTIFSPVTKRKKARKKTPLVITELPRWRTFKRHKNITVVRTNNHPEHHARRDSLSITYIIFSYRKGLFLNLLFFPRDGNN